MMPTWLIDGRADTAFELVVLGVLCVLLLLLIFVLYRIDAAVVWNAADMLKAPAAGGPPVLYAGSWNPPHCGHVALLRCMAAQHAKIYACVGHNAAKRYAVPAARRWSSSVDADDALRGRVEVVVEAGYVWRAAARRGCRVLYRGVRSWRDDGPAEHVLHARCRRSSSGRCARPGDALHRRRRSSKVSSTAVRDAVAPGASLDGLVPAAIATDVRTLYSPKVKGG
ncbi:Cytidylyltransferase-like protein [Aureococcus anophagefferens]|nr:Cytidylyltransferase-like protein [Aureococcus anophagefferens]